MPTSDTIHKWTLAPEVPSAMWNPDTGADIKCPVMEPMCQIMFYNQLPTSDTIHNWTLAPEVGRFHIGALTNVEPAHWGGHQVSGHETDVSNHIFVINCQLMTPFTSGPWLQKWAGSTSVPSPMWNPDTGVVA